MSGEIVGNAHIYCAGKPETLPRGYVWRCECGRYWIRTYSLFFGPGWARATRRERRAARRNPPPAVPVEGLTEGLGPRSRSSWAATQGG